MCALLSCSTVSSTVSSHLHTVVLLIYSGLVGLASAGGPVTVVPAGSRDRAPGQRATSPMKQMFF